MTIQFSRRLAIVAGLLLPIVETVRRWHQLGDLAVWPLWLDDLATLATNLVERDFLQRRLDEIVNSKRS